MDIGTYAVKCLNPAIMSRTYALTNMINSEKISEIIGLQLPVIRAKIINDKHVHLYHERYYMFFDWIDGKSIYPPDITVEHCKVIGDMIGKIHSLDIAVEGVVYGVEDSTMYQWKEYLELSSKNKATWTSVYQEACEDIMSWNQQLLKAKEILSKKMVISHRDLDPKNVLWQGDCPYIIDWEAAGYVNPYQELLEVINYWADDGSGGLHKNLCLAILDSYVVNNPINHVNWDLILESGYEGMLGWLEYNIKRALGIEISSKEEISLGEQQVIGTIGELKRYQDKKRILSVWLKLYS